jgi:hypothetical protein
MAALSFAIRRLAAFRPKYGKRPFQKSIEDVMWAKPRVINAAEGILCAARRFRFPG